MPYTFGGGTGDDFNITATTAGATASVELVTGWFYPTTLTAGRGLWSWGNVAGCKIHTTTSELQLISDNTTDGLTTTSGLGLAVNVWHFLAFLGTFNDTGPVNAWRVWKGTIDFAPTVIATVATVAPIGNHVGSLTWYVGNLGTGTVAFQGDIANVTFMHGAGTGATAGLLAPISMGALTQADEDIVFNDLVLPLYRGEYNRMETFDSARPRWFAELSSTAVYGRPSAINLETLQLAGVNGATVSANNCPRPPISRPAWPWHRR